MNIAVCVKQIPDPDVAGRIDPDSFTLDRSSKLVCDDSDTFGIEMGLQLRDASGQGEVVVISVAPRSETSGLRTALAMGADRAVLVSDPQLSGSDALATAKVLAAVIRRLGPDLVVSATESSDGYTGTVPVQIAELLSIPTVTFAKEVRSSDGLLHAIRQTEAGFDDVECPLPAVLTVTAGVVEPRYPSFRGIVSAKTKPVEILTIADLGIDPSEVGFTGARQEILGIEPVETRSQGALVHDTGDAHQQLLAFLAELKLI
jgi:electron transfer flavoprotein beta subunit